jgi:hypothetical protein
MSVAYATPMDMREFDEWGPRRCQDELLRLVEENARLRSENERLRELEIPMPEGQPTVFALRAARQQYRIRFVGVTAEPDALTAEEIQT